MGGAHGHRGPTAHIAIDLGAESGRVIVGEIRSDSDDHREAQRLTMHEMHRFFHGDITDETGGRHWDVEEIWLGIREGLRSAARWSASSGVAIRSVGVDTWGVDFALLDAQEQLLAPPRCYRDPRHFVAMDAVLGELANVGGAHRLFRVSGTAPMFFNTIFQLVSMQRAEPALLAKARALLFMPDFLHWKLSGSMTCEETIASTSGLVDATTGDWSDDLLNAVGIPSHMLRPIRPCGQAVGRIRPDLARELGLSDSIEVVAPAGHDTASAVAAVPAEASSRWAYLSSGTWSLIGLELPGPILNERACSARLTNERGPNGTMRLLRNIVGLWMVQEYRRERMRRGQDESYRELTQLAADAQPMRSLVNATHESFHAPGDMSPRIAALASRTGEPAPVGPGPIVRCCLESLALEYGRTLREIEGIAGRSIDVLHVVGGGSLNDLLNQFTADATGCTVIAGPAEATAAGNILVQAAGVGAIAADAVRRIARDSFELRRFVPQPAEAERWTKARERYARLREISLRADRQPS